MVKLRAKHYPVLSMLAKYFLDVKACRRFVDQMLDADYTTCFTSPQELAVEACLMAWSNVLEVH